MTKKYTRRKATLGSKRSAAVLWALKTMGDVNENHEGGNATRTLFDWINEQDPTVFPNVSAFGSTLNNLKASKKIAALVKGNKSYAIRLMVSDSEMPDENPFATTAVATRHLPAVVGQDTFWSDWSISQRLALVEAVSLSVREDVEKFKNGVADGL